MEFIKEKELLPPQGSVIKIQIQNRALLILSKPWSAPGPGKSYLPASEYMAKDSSGLLAPTHLSSQT